jgi:hypothetical protein
MTDQIDKIRAEIARKAKIAKEQAETGRQTIMTMMHQLNIPIIKVHFAGAGDSGSIDEIVILDSLDMSYWDGKPVKETSQELYEHIDVYCDNYLAGCDVDWYNNDGGQGTITFDCSTVPHRFEAIVEYNVMHSEVGHHTDEVM